MEDLVHALANWALNRVSSAAAKGAGGADSQLDNDVRARQMQQHQHLSEAMEMLPNLQFGLDVNPKFTNGPDGCEVS